MGLMDSDRGWQEVCLAVAQRLEATVGSTVTYNDKNNQQQISHWICLLPRLTCICPPNDPKVQCDVGFEALDLAKSLIDQLRSG